MGAGRAWSWAQAQGPGAHFLFNLGPGGRRYSGRLSSNTAKFIGYRLCRQLLAFLNRKLEIWPGPRQKSLDSEASELQACSLRAFLDRKLTDIRDVAMLIHYPADT